MRDEEEGGKKEASKVINNKASNTAHMCMLMRDAEGRKKEAHQPSCSCCCIYNIFVDVVGRGYH